MYMHATLSYICTYVHIHILGSTGYMVVERNIEGTNLYPNKNETDAMHRKDERM